VIGDRHGYLVMVQFLNLTLDSIAYICSMRGRRLCGIRGM
jgi:hypothetical protein